MSVRLLRLSRHAMGTDFEVILAGEDAEFLRDAGHQALDEIEQLEARLSHYRPDSEICDLNLRAPHEPVRLEPGLFRLIERAVALSAVTEGAFDPTAGPLVRAWGFFRSGSRAPSGQPAPEEVEAARRRVGAHRLVLDPAACTVRFPEPGMELHLGAIGKGYAVDRALDLLRSLGVEAALVHGGTSTVGALGAPPGAPAWEVGLRDPTDPERRLGVFSLRDRALSTSGDYEQFFVWEGRRYSHLLDPRTGQPAAGVRSATVLAESATDTDALSTAIFVLGEAGARRLCGEFPGLGVVLVPESLGQPPSSETPDLLLFGDVSFRREGP